jgi:hypothetical protein
MEHTWQYPGSSRRTPTKITIPGIRSGRVTYADAREPDAGWGGETWQTIPGIRSGRVTYADAPEAGEPVAAPGPDIIPPDTHKKKKNTLPDASLRWGVIL